MGNKIKEFRNKNGLTTYELAKKVNMSQSQISKMENNNRMIKADEAIRIAKILGVTVEQLLI